MLNPPARRPVIGVLPAWPIYADEMPDHYSEKILQGILAQARISGCNLLLAVGIGRLAWPVAARDSDYVPIGPWNTDGLIVFTPLVDEARTAYIQQARAQGHPVYFIATGEGGPYIQADSETGIRQAVRHLVGHGHQKIAFIAGDPKDPGDTVARLSAYQAALAECQLDYKPGLVAYGYHIEWGGCEAMKQILAAGQPFSAVLASNDASAIGALQALQEAGLQVPGQIALIGFDDQPDAAAQVPALTSVHTPLAEIGAQAVERLLANIVHGEPLACLTLPTHLVCRQSCGCLPDAMQHAAAPAAGWQPALPAPLGQAELAARLNRAMLPAVEQHPEELAQAYAGLVSALLESLQCGETACFDRELLAHLQSIERAGGDFRPIQDTLSRLRHELLHLAPHWPGEAVPGLIETFFQRARVAVAESLQWANLRSRYTLENYSYQLSMLTARLSSFLDIRQLVKILEEDLVKIGIRHARLILYEPQDGDPLAGSRWQRSTAEADPGLERFLTRQFPSAQLYPAAETLSLALVPVVFQCEPLGYLAFDSGRIEVLPPIVRQVSANLKAAQLHAEVVALSLNDALTGAYNRRYLELFMRKEIARHQRFRHNLALIMVDIDGFKPYNDSFGHLAGDEALKLVKQCLQNQMRETDIVARYGGDEFILVLAETDGAGARAVAAQIRAAIASQSGFARPVTLSMGIAVLAPEDDSLHQLIARADEALYEAKAGGKDRFCVFLNQ